MRPSKILRVVKAASACFFLLTATLHAQNPTFSLVDNLNPVTPTAWQFVKYDQMPVREYTGMPNISVPLYEIDEDGVKVPIALSYHAGGIRVNEEASWVGLGWDLAIGSIVQSVNDQDDLSATVTRVRPDFYNTSQPIQYPYKYNYSQCASGGWSQCLNGCTGLLPVYSPSVAEGFFIYTDQYAPYGGDYGYNKGKDYHHFFDSHNYYNADSEPDIFTMSTPSGAIKFVVNWSYNGNYFTVLDKKGYSVTYDGSSTLKVMFPTGDEYDFQRMNTVETYSNSDGQSGSGAFPGGTSPTQPSSIVWMLTKITTKNKRLITFAYNVPSSSYSVFPSYTQKGMADSLTFLAPGGGVTPNWVGVMVSGVPGTGISSAVLGTRTFSQEKYVTLSSITFPKGQVTFYADTNRTDLMGGYKLDSVTVSASFKVKSYNFSYSYFNATGVGGNTYTPLGTVNFGSHPLYRLRLDSMADNSGAKHRFTYNPTQLPAKNSFATDYWGYYNGRTANTTAVPNGSQFVNSSLHINMSSYGNNGDNHSANVSYTQAGTLTQIKYPTGGSVNFAYELNQFSNYWVPDYSSSTNTISSGDGLRVQSITWKDAGGNQLKKTNYTYSGGVAITPVNMFRQYNMDIVYSGGVPPWGTNAYKTFRVNESNMTGFFSSNPLSSVNGVGYSQVTKTDVDASGNANGKEVQSYYNNPDLTFNTTVETLSQVDAVLPAYKDSLRYDNGSLASELIYDKNNHLLRKTVNNYVNSYSPISYGARLFGYGDLCTWNCVVDNNNVYEQQLWSQSMVGYYPIYDFESLLTSSVETNYYNADSVVTTMTNNYDTYNQLASIIKTNSTYKQTLSFSYPYTYQGTLMDYPVLDSMTAHNRLTDIVRFGKNSQNSNATFTRHYVKNGALFLASQDSDYAVASLSNPNITTYDRYDPTYGNILQYSQNTVPTALIWDYNREYVVAMAKNASYSNIAYTSFEADGTGRWKFTGTTTPDPQAPTGEKAYSLAGGSIYRDSLNAALSYVVSYWSKNGAQTVSGSTATTKGYTFNGYTYYEHTVPTPTGGTITVSGTGTIDELRLYPNTAQMKTYTYSPLVGVSSESNESGRIAYYEYDNAMRLIDIRDQNKHIIKAFCYNYAGQPTTCGLDITYSSQALSQSFTRNNCGSGYIGSPVTYNVPLGKYTSTMSLQDANSQAQADMVANGQANANTNGSCAVPPTITTVQYAGHGTGLTQINFTTAPGCTTIAVLWTDITTGLNYSDYGGCTSPRTETVTVGHDYQFTITEYSSTFGTVTSAPVSYHAYD